MSEEGFMGMSALWLTMAAAAVVLSVLFLTKVASSSGRTRSEETKLIYLVQSAALLERETNFPSEIRDSEFALGRVHLQRIFDASKENVRLLCEAKSGRLEKQIEVDWRRVGSDWRAVAWREQ